eukprot:jgi/Bigna1/60097/fgenesh1_kg.9_\
MPRFGNAHLLFKIKQRLWETMNGVCVIFQIYTFEYLIQCPLEVFQPNAIKILHVRLINVKALHKLTCFVYFEFHSICVSMAIVPKQWCHA